MEIDICKIYNEFWDKNEINKKTKPEHINVHWTGLELEMFVKFAIEQANEANTSKEECTLHNVSRLLPTLDVIDERLNNITGRATETNWQYKRAGF